MKRIFTNILALVLGWLIGSAVNMGLISAGHSIFPVEGMDTSDMEAMKEAMAGVEAQHFIFPFLAHALGTFIGALVAVKIAASHKTAFAMAIGLLFLLGGIYMVVLLPSPMWFNVLDIVVAYLPMAWLAARLAR